MWMDGVCMACLFWVVVGGLLRPLFLVCGEECLESARLQSAFGIEPTERPFEVILRVVADDHFDLFDQAIHAKANCGIGDPVGGG